MRKLGALLALALVVAACGSDGSEEAPGATSTSGSDPFYAGKNVEIVVPYAPGGGNDLVARYFAPLLSEHVPGQPNFTVLNIDGAGTLLGSNEFASREPDGLSWFESGSTTNFVYILGHPDAQFDFKEMVPVLGVPQSAVVYTASDLGISNASELLEVDEPLSMAMIAAEGGELIRLMSLDVLGADIQAIFGYEGGAATRLAFEQGEVNLGGDTTATYLENVQPLVGRGEVVPLYSLGMIEDGEVVRDPALPDLPHVGEVYEQIHGTQPQGELWDSYKALLAPYTLNKVLWVPADAPGETIEAAKEGVLAVAESQEYKDTAVESLGSEAIYGDALDAAADLLIHPNQEAVDFAKEHARTKYDANL